MDKLYLYTRSANSARMIIMNSKINLLKYTKSRKGECMRYPSAKSAGFGVLLGVVIIVFFAALIFFLWQKYWLVTLLPAAAIAFILWLWFGTYYEFKADYLLARMGPFFERIPYQKITSARKFTSMVSSMALSSKMIEVRHGKNYITGTTYISPLDRDAFLAMLYIYCPQIGPITEAKGKLRKIG
jgi:hypothetical protein